MNNPTRPEAAQEAMRLAEIYEHAKLDGFDLGEKTRGLVALAAYVRELEAERDRLRGLLHDVAESGVSMHDPRVRYVEIQVDRETWAKIREGLS